MSYEFRHKYLHLISTNPRLAPRMSFRTIRVRNSELQRSKVGFPIRKSADQRLFAPPHGLSQRTTSFIACAYLGIHRTPLRHLIALIINARSPAACGRRKQHRFDPPSSRWRISTWLRRRRTKSRKTSVTRELSVGGAVKHRQLRSFELECPDNSSLHDVSKQAARPWRTRCSIGKSYDEQMR